MEQETIAKIIDTLKSEGIDLVVTLPEEPTSPLTETIRRHPYFTSVTVANENNGVALCAAASLGGRRCIFVTGIAGLLVGTWSLAQMGVLYGIPVLIMASYRGDISDRSGVSGAQLFMFLQLGEPMLNTLRVPYRVIKKRPISNARSATAISPAANTARRWCCCLRARFYGETIRLPQAVGIVARRACAYGYQPRRQRQRVGAPAARGREFSQS
jgi:sulfopyruvate decarboxylase subunit alpha